MSDCFSRDFLVQSGSYSETMNEVVLPWLESQAKAEEVPGAGNCPLYSIRYDAAEPAGTVFIVHGFTENAFKYAELVYSLLHLRYSVVIYDQRGHGRSWRAEGVPDASVTHVDRFSDYVEDLRFITGRYCPVMPKPHLLFAHSMGGAVAALYLEKYHDVFSAAVFSSPMIAPNLRGIPSAVAEVVAAGARLFGKQKSNPFFMKPYSGPEDFNTSCATDPARFAWYDAVKADRSEFRNSVPSYQWSLESMHVTRSILSPGAPESISCPLLLFAADDDHSVLPKPQSLFIDRVPKGKRIFVPGSRHEIFRSTNDVLFPWWHQVIGFFRHGLSFIEEGDHHA